MLLSWETCESPDGAEAAVASGSALLSLSVPRVLLAAAQGFPPPVTPSPVPGPPGGIPGRTAPRAFGGMGPAACAFPASCSRPRPRPPAWGRPPCNSSSCSAGGNPPLSSACPSPPGRLQGPDLSPSRAVGGLMVLFFPGAVRAGFLRCGKRTGDPPGEGRRRTRLGEQGKRSEAGGDTGLRPV